MIYLIYINIQLNLIVDSHISLKPAHTLCLDPLSASELRTLKILKIIIHNSKQSSIISISSDHGRFKVDDLRERISPA
jgi:hypothetical protein